MAASRDGRRVVATVANPSASLWRVPLLDRPAEDRDVQPYPVPTGRALAPRFGGTSLFYLSARGTATDSGGSRTDRRPKSGRAWTARCPSRLPCRRTGAASPWSSQRRENGTWRSCRRTARVRRTGRVHRHRRSRPTGRRTATWIVAGGSDAQGPALFKIPVDGGAPVRLVAGQAVNPVWSPDGNLIVYAGALVRPDRAARGVRPDGTPSSCRPVRVRPGGYRFLPNGSGLVYLPRIQSLDFWLLDFATKKTRPLTHLSNQGTIGTFDITPDGKHIVFDRSRQNSDIVLIDLPK